MQFLFGDISKQDYNPAENFPDQNKSEISVMQSTWNVRSSGWVNSELDCTHLKAK